MTAVLGLCSASGAQTGGPAREGHATERSWLGSRWAGREEDKNEFSDQWGKKGPFLTGKLWLEDLEKQTAVVRAMLAPWVC